MIRALDRRTAMGHPLVRPGGTELVSFGDNEAVVSRWRLDGSGPITRLVAPGYRGGSSTRTASSWSSSAAVASAPNPTT